HLPVVAIPARLAAEGQPLPEAKVARDVRLIEPRAFETARPAVAEHDADDELAVVEMACVHLDDLADHRLQGAGGQGGDGAQVGQVLVSAWEVKQQVPDGAQAEAPEELHALGRGAGDS